MVNDGLSFAYYFGKCAAFERCFLNLQIRTFSCRFRLTMLGNGVGRSRTVTVICSQRKGGDSPRVVM